MAYNPTLRSISNPIGKSLTKDFSSTGPNRIGRIRDIVLEDTHPTYREYGQQALRGVHYEFIDEPYFGEELTSLPFAFNDSIFLKGVPVIGELIELVKKPKFTSGDTSYKDVSYYTYPINLWNNTHHNFQPDPKADITEAFLGDSVIEREDIRNLQPFPGDLILEGRLGQSLRFSGYSHPKSLFTDESNNSDPYSILRVGQDDSTDTLETYVEDINKDKSSVYLTSNHKIPVNVSTLKVETFKNDDQPVSISEYKGNQVVVDSGRLVFHAKSDSIFINSKNSTLVGSRTFNVDSTDYISFDAPEIFIGKLATEPVVLGNQNEQFLRRLLNLLSNIATSFNAVKDPISAVSVLASLSPIISSEVNALTSKLGNLKSKKIKVE